MRIVPSFVLAAGLALVAAAPAQAEPLASAGRLTDLRVEREPVGPVVTTRGQQFPPGSFVTMRDELENFPVDTSFGGTGVSAPPTSFTGPPGFVWPLNNLRGQANVNFVHMVDLSGAPVSGPNMVVNASKALRIFAANAQPPGGFFTGANLRFGGQTDEPTLPLDPLPGSNARVSAEHWVSSIDTLYSFEPVSVFSGFITGRLLWGGTCMDNYPGGCVDDGFPFGLIDSIYVLGPHPVTPGPLFVPTRFCEDVSGNPVPGCVPPPGFDIGDLVPPPIQNWFRLAGETTADGRMRFLIDHLDGSAEAVIYENVILTTRYMDRVGWNASFEAQDEFMLVDNIEASGPIYQPPIPPALMCPYLDDMEWLYVFPLWNQSPRWEAAISSAARVITDGVRGKVISQINNVSSDNEYRREMATILPTSSATMSNDVVATVHVRTTGSTVRGFAIYDGIVPAARVIFGRETETMFYEPSVYVQIDSEYDPIDDPFGIEPFTNAPVVGIDVADAEYDWQNNAVYRTLELRLSANGALRVSIDGQRIYTGVGAFSNTIDRFSFESENNAYGSGSSLRIDDITLTCDAPSCAADFDFDDTVTFADLNAVLSNFGATGLTGFNPGDADGDGAVDFIDLNAVLSAFGTSCE